MPVLAMVSPDRDGAQSYLLYLFFGKHTAERLNMCEFKFERGSRFQTQCLILRLCNLNFSRVQFI